MTPLNLLPMFLLQIEAKYFIVNTRKGNYLVETQDKTIPKYRMNQVRHQQRNIKTTKIDYRLDFDEKHFQLKGRIQNQTCETTEDCKSPLRCKYTEVSDNEGSCLDTGKIGDLCTDDDECDEPMFCSAEDKCVTGGASIGEDCSQIDCGRELVCGPDLEDIEAICLTPLTRKEGEVCWLGFPHCDEGLNLICGTTGGNKGICMVAGSKDQNELCWSSEECKK